MKTFLTVIAILVVAGIGWMIFGGDRGQFAFLGDDGTPTPSVQATVSVSPSPGISPGGAATASPARTATPRPGTATATPTATFKPLFITVNEANSSGEYGTLTITGHTSGKAVLTFNLTGAPAGVSQPVAIYAGTCQALGVKRYGLNPMMNGSSETILDITAAQLLALQGSLSVAVYKSPEEPNHQFACGRIK